METQGFRTILNDEFEYRKKENPSYSLRAFARDLHITPSQLSEVLKGKTGISSKKAIQLAKNMGLSEKETEIFRALVEIEHGRSSTIITNAKKILEGHQYGEQFKGLSVEGFKFISDWVYFAILSTMELDQYDGTTEFISKKLKIPLHEIEECIKTLLKLDIIDIKSGKFF